MLVAGRIFLAIRIFSEHEIFYESFVLQEPSNNPIQQTK
jgi:hypothetical protein